MEKPASFLHTVVNEKASSLRKPARFLVKRSTYFTCKCAVFLWIQSLSNAFVIVELHALHMKLEIHSLTELHDFTRETTQAAHWCLHQFWAASVDFQCTSSISHNVPFRREICTLLFSMLHCKVWNRCVVGVVRLFYLIHFCACFLDWHCSHFVLLSQWE